MVFGFRRRLSAAGIVAEAALGAIAREEEEPKVMRLVVVIVAGVVVGGTVSECVREGATLREDLESGGDRISSSSDSTTSLLFLASGRTDIAGGEWRSSQEDATCGVARDVTHARAALGPWRPLGASPE